MRILFGGDALADEWCHLAREQGEQHDAKNRRAREAALPRPARPDDDERGAHRRDGENEIPGNEYFMIDVPERSVGTAAIHEHVVHVETKAPRENEEHDAGEDGEVSPHVSRDVEAATIPAQARRERVQEDE